MQRLEETKLRRKEIQDLKESGKESEIKKPLFRSAIEELLDAEVDDKQIVDEVNVMMFGVL